MNNDINGIQNEMEQLENNYPFHINDQSNVMDECYSDGDSEFDNISDRIHEIIDEDMIDCDDSDSTTSSSESDQCFFSEDCDDNNCGDEEFENHVSFLMDFQYLNCSVITNIYLIFIIVVIIVSFHRIETNKIYYKAHNHH